MILITTFISFITTINQLRYLILLQLKLHIIKDKKRDTCVKPLLQHMTLDIYKICPLTLYTTTTAKFITRPSVKSVSPSGTTNKGATSHSVPSVLTIIISDT